MKIKNWRILVMVGWILFFAHAAVWSAVLMFTSTSVYRGENHSLGPIFSYLTDHESFAKFNSFAIVLLALCTIVVFVAGRKTRHRRWSKVEYGFAKTAIVIFICSFLTYLCLFLMVFNDNWMSSIDGIHPSLGSRVYEVENIESDKFVVLFDSIRNSKWEYTHYVSKYNGVLMTIPEDQDSTVDEANVMWAGRCHFCNIYLPKGKTEVMMLVYRSTNSDPLEIVFGGDGMTPADIAEFEALTLNKICTYTRCEKRWNKESYYSYMKREEILFIAGFIGFSIIASLIVLLNLKASRDKYLPPPFNPT